MKKFYICLIIIITILGAMCISNAAQFYDTIDTKYESATEILHMLGIIDGVSEHTFSPKRVVTRAEMAKLILCTYKWDMFADDAAIVKFKDVKESDWYFKYVNLAAATGIIEGYDDGTFKPNKEVTYGEACAMIVRALGYGNINPPAGQSWDQGYINKASSLKILKSVGVFKNNDGAIRGNVAIMIWNMLNADTYLIIKEKTNIGMVKETIGRKVIQTYYPDYYIIDDEIITDIYAYRILDEDFDDYEYIYKYCLTLENFGDIDVDDPVALKCLGAKVSGIYNVKSKKATGLNVVYDEDFDDGLVSELEDTYKLNNKTRTYSFGKNKMYEYVYLDTDGKVDRVAFLGSNEDILVETLKTEKEKDQPEHTIINGDYDVDENIILMDADGKIHEWREVKEGDVISILNNGVYVLSKTRINGEVNGIIDDKDNLQLKIDGKVYECDENAVYTTYDGKARSLMTYKKSKDYVGKRAEIAVNYLGRIIAANITNANSYGVVTRVIEEKERKYLEIETASGRKKYYISSDIKTLPNIGDIVTFEIDEGFIKVVDTLKNNLKIDDKKVAVNLKSPKYEDGKFAGYDIVDTTTIYLVQKTYVMNSDVDIEDYKLVIAENNDILETVDDKPVHIVYNENYEVVAIFIEEDVNKYKYKYARILDVFTERDVSKKSTTIKVRISPFNTVIADYEVNGILKCEIGDIISYQSDGEKLTIKETYSAKNLGDPKDLIVESINGKKVYFTNGDMIDFRAETFEANFKKYNFSEYHVVYAKVSDVDGEWKFETTSIVDKNTVNLKKNDRIAIDEIEDLMIIYRGYEE